MSTFFVTILHPIGSDNEPITYTRDNYGEALDLFKQKCVDYATHAATLGADKIYTVRLLADRITGMEVLQEINIHSTQRHKYGKFTTPA